MSFTIAASSHTAAAKSATAIATATGNYAVTLDRLLKFE
jgi:hypothetical protein